MHSLGIVHRDIKSHNVLTDPEFSRFVVCDFGTARSTLDCHIYEAMTPRGGAAEALPSPLGRFALETG